jgi:hypothetical protein
MENKILSKKEILNLYNQNKLNFSRILKSQHFNTYNFIDRNFNYIKSTNSNNRGKNKFTEKIYQYITGIKGICKQCKRNPTTFRSFSRGYFEFCSKSCIQKFVASKYDVKNLFQSEVIKEKMKHTWIKNHGVDNPTKSKEIKQKSKNTRLQKYGDENFNNPIGLKNTCLKKYGVSNPNKLKEVRDKIKQTSISKYGVSSYTQTSEYKEKTLSTNIKKYGYANPNQSPEFQQKLQKTSFRFKSYILPSGKEIKVQGYEPFALNVLLKNYNESDIVVDRKMTPKFWYFIDNKRKIYYPDIFIKSTNTIIEIKSDWTNKLHPVIDALKKDSVLKEGYNFQKMIFDRKGNLLNE